MARALNLIGHTYGRLLVVGRSPSRTPSAKVVWVCRCTCGTETLVTTQNLRRPVEPTVSCGCYKAEQSARNMLANRHDDAPKLTRPFTCAQCGTACIGHHAAKYCDSPACWTASRSALQHKYRCGSPQQQLAAVRAELEKRSGTADRLDT